jgi:hypothetical protein
MSSHRQPHFADETHDVYMSIIEESKSDFWRSHSDSRGSAKKFDAPTFQEPLRSRAADDVRPPPFLAQFLPPVRQCLPHERDAVWHCEQIARLRDFRLTIRASAAVRLQRWWRRVSVDPLRPTAARLKLMLRRQEEALLVAARQPRRKNASDLAAGARSLRERLQAELDAELRAETEACVARRRTEAERTAAHLVLSVANAEARDTSRYVQELRETAARK